jgi:hypothetical protein
VVRKKMRMAKRMRRKVVARKIMNMWIISFIKLAIMEGKKKGQEDRGKKKGEKRNIKERKQKENTNECDLMNN